MLYQLSYFRRFVRKKTLSFWADCPSFYKADALIERDFNSILGACEGFLRFEAILHLKSYEKGRVDSKLEK